MKRLILLNLALLFMPSIIFASEPVLVLKKSFPDYESVIPEDFLVRPIDAEFYNGYFIVSDAGEHCIKLFNLEGVFKKKIGKKGNGPGELLNPLYIAIDKKEDKIYCVDEGNKRISCFLISGEFITSFKTLTISINEIIAENGFIYASAYNEATSSFLAIYNSKGRLTYTFGDLFDLKVNKLGYRSQIYSNIFLDSSKDSIYVSFSYLPLIQVFKKSGDLIKMIKLEEKRLWSFYNNNLNKTNVEVNGGYLLRGMMAGAYINDNRIYLYYPELRGILVFDKDGQLIQKIKFENENALKSLKFFITIVDSEFVFLDIMDAQVKIYSLSTSE